MHLHAVGFSNKAYTSYNLYTLQDNITARQVAKQYYDRGASELSDAPFSFLLETPKSLLCVADCFAVDALYYALEPDTLHVFSSLADAKDYTGALNPDYIADYLTYHTPAQETTIYQNIYKLPAAHYLEVIDGAVTIKPYWQGERNTQPNTQPLTDIIAAVLSPTDSVIGVELSGGLDSSSIATLLPVNQQSVHLFSNMSEAADAKESSYIQAVLAQLPYPFRHQPQYANTPYAFVTRLHQWFAKDKAPNFGGYGLFAAPLLQSAQAAGVRQLYSGFGGDQTFSWHATGFLVSLWQQKRWREIINILRQDRFLSALKRLLLAVPFFYRFAPIQHAANAKVRARLSRTFIGSAFATQQHQYDTMQAALRSTLCNFYEHKFYGATRLGHVARVVEARTTEAKKYGIQYVFTLLQRKIFDAVSSVPMHAHYDGTVSRKLVRDTMRGYLPDVLLDEDKKFVDAIPGVQENFVQQHGDWLLKRLQWLAEDAQVCHYIDIHAVCLCLEDGIKSQAKIKALRYLVHAWLMAEFLVWNKEENAHTP